MNRVLPEDLFHTCDMNFTDRYCH